MSLETLHITHLRGALAEHGTALSIAEVALLRGLRGTL
jgi:hypothetical protein